MENLRCNHNQTKKRRCLKNKFNINDKVYIIINHGDFVEAIVEGIKINSQDDLEYDLSVGNGIYTRLDDSVWKNKEDFLNK